MFNNFTRRLSVLFTFFVFLVSVSVMLGWVLNISAIVQVKPTFVAMQFNTALGFFFSSIAFWLWLAGRNRYVKYFALLVFLIGFLTSLEYLAGIDIGLDELIWTHNITTNVSSPGRMAPDTALAFMCFSTAMMLICCYKKQHNTFFVCSLYGLSGAVLALGFISLIGYFLDFKINYGWGSVTLMAIHTSLCFILLGLNLLFFSINTFFHDERSNVFLSVFVTIFGIILNVLFWHILNYQKIHYLNLDLTLSIVPKRTFFGGIFDFFSWLVLIFGIFLSVAMGLLVYLYFAILSKNKKLDEKAELLTSINTELEQFAYIASHDLRTPLRSINGFTSILSSKYTDLFDDDARRYMNHIIQGTQRMDKLLDDVLSFAKLGRQDAARELIDLNVVFDEVVENLDSLIQDSKAQIHKNQLPKIMGIRSSLIQLFQNLISNSIKYSRDGIVPEINISVQKKLNDYLITVTDNGIGIEEKYVEKVFGLFERVHLKEKYEGTGLGLAICKKAMDSMKGDIWIESEFGSGTTVFLKFPLTF